MLLMRRITDKRELRVPIADAEDALRMKGVIKPVYVEPVEDLAMVCACESAYVRE